MSKQLILGLLVAAALPTAVLAKASAAETLTRTGKWVVDYNRDACNLLAQFGTGKEMHVMRITRYQPGEWFDFSLYGRKLASADPTSEAKLDFGLGGTPVEVKTMNGNAANLPMMLFGMTRLDGWEWERTRPGEIGPSVSPQQEAAISRVTVKIAGKKPFRLEFGSLAKPMEQLRKCQADLVKSWGYDPAVQSALAKPVRPVNPPGAWLRADDYPAGALFKGQNGIVQFRLDVDADGKVSGCHVLARTSPDVFADTTCRVVARRAKLEPALDANGKPVRSFYVQKVRWETRN